MIISWDLIMFISPLGSDWWVSSSKLYFSCMDNLLFRCMYKSSELNLHVHIARTLIYNNKDPMNISHVNITHWWFYMYSMCVCIITHLTLIISWWYIVLDTIVYLQLLISINSLKCSWCISWYEHIYTSNKWAWKTNTALYIDKTI